MVKITDKQRNDLKKFVKELDGRRARHTELITVYVPQGYDINKISNHIAEEKGTATNIKSNSTRNNVITALERMVQHLKLFTKTPPNGVALFSGNIAEQEGGQDFKVWSIEPPVPLNIRIYRCDKQFMIEPLKDMLDTKEVYGMVVMDRREADLAFLKGKTIIPTSSAKSNVPGKTRAGGQSAARYMRIREDAAKDFYRKVAEMMKDDFFSDITHLKGIIIGGPGPTKYELTDGGFITGDIKKKIIGIRDLSYTGEFGLQELLEKSEDLLAAESVIEEKKIVLKFFEMLAKTPGKVGYGEEEVKKMIKMGAAEIVLISEEIDDKKAEEIEALATPMSTEVRIISTETREGVQLKGLGGIAVILRYEANV